VAILQLFLFLISIRGKSTSYISCGLSCSDDLFDLTSIFGFRNSLHVSNTSFERLFLMR